MIYVRRGPTIAASFYVQNLRQALTALGFLPDDIKHARAPCVFSRGAAKH